MYLFGLNIMIVATLIFSQLLMSDKNRLYFGKELICRFL